MRCLWLMFVVEGHSTNFVMTEFSEDRQKDFKKYLPVHLPVTT